MKKTRSDAKWLNLTRDQLELLETWLLDDNLSYDDALARAKSEFGFVGSKTSLRRFYRRAELKRRRCEARAAKGVLTVVGPAPADLSEEALLGSGMRVAAQQFLERVQGEEIEDPATLAKLLLQSEANGLRREANALRRRNQELRERDQRFDERRWEFDVEEEAKRLLPMLREVLDRMGPAKKTYRYAKFINRVRMKLFGCCPDPAPESAKEEAERDAAKAAGSAEYEADQAQLRERRGQVLDADDNPEAAPPDEPGQLKEGHGKILWRFPERPEDPPNAA